MKIPPYAGIKIQVSPDYRVTRTVIRYLRTKKGPRRIRAQAIQVFSHWENALEDGKCLEFRQQGVYMMNPRTKHELDKAIQDDMNKRVEETFNQQMYGIKLNRNPLIMPGS